MQKPRTRKGDKETEDFLDRFDRADERRKRIEVILNDAYEYCLPLRERPLMGHDGKPHLDRLFDGTAPACVQDLASEMLDDIWPTDAKPFELRAGRMIPEDQRQEVDRALAEVTEEIIETINNSNFRAAAHEALQDWTIGTGLLLPELGDAVDPIRFRCLPLCEAIIDRGPTEAIDRLYRVRPNCRVGDLGVIWPEAKIPEKYQRMANEKPDEAIKVVEGFERDRSDRGNETWVYRVVLVDDAVTLLKRDVKGWGMKPFIDFHYIRVAGETYGRGPAMLALPDIKTLNAAKELVLENGELAIMGAWQYDDDGVINPDTITIESGTLIPRTPGTKGLEPLTAPGNFNIADLLVKDIQDQIRAIFFGDDLGPPKNTPMSATEVMERTSRRARRRAGPYTRLIVELMNQTVIWTARALVELGRIKLPRIDGRAVLIRPLAPITRAQAQDEILRHDKFLELMNGRLGPQTTLMLVKPDEFGPWLARKLGVNPELVRTKLEQKQLAAAMAQAAAVAHGVDQGQGIPAMPGAPA